MDKEGFEMDGIGEDLFFLSNGHISVFYSVLARSGYFCFRISYISFNQHEITRSPNNS
jgi:transketolase N-terminal domain/subunit